MVAGVGGEEDLRDVRSENVADWAVDFASLPIENWWRNIRRTCLIFTLCSL